MKLSLGQKIGISYTLVTLIALLTLSGVGAVFLTLWGNNGCREWQGGAKYLQAQFANQPPPLTPKHEAEAWLNNFVQRGAAKSKIGEFIEINIYFSKEDLTKAALISPSQKILAFYPNSAQGFSGRDTWKKAFAEYKPPSLSRQAPIVAQRQNACIVEIPIKERSQLRGWLVFVYKVPAAKQRLFLWGSVFLLLITLTAPLVLFVGTVSGWLISRSMIQRFGDIGKAVKEWSKGNLKTTIDDNGQDEIGLLAQRLNTMANRLNTLLKTQQELAVLEERQRLARDLHDAVKQQIFAATMQLAAAQKQIQQNPQKAQLLLEDATSLMHQSQVELTNIIQQLRPLNLKNAGFASVLQEYLNTWERRTGIQVKRAIKISEPLSPSIAEALLRIIQEGLSNVARHSNANALTFMLRQEAQKVRLTIADNGQGFEPNSVALGNGLRNMAERTEELGGRFQLHSTPGKGTTIEVEIPLEEGE